MQDFDTVYREYFDIVYRYVLSLCRDEDWAQEITQEAFFRALKNIDHFRGECRLNVWLCQIAKNTYFSQLKQRQRFADVPLEQMESDESPEQDFLKRQQAVDIHRYVHRLKEPYREVFWMRTFADLSFAEIASIFNKTESWARVTYHRARMTVRKEMQDENAV
ncbi:MAG: RNA polymerase sigma factor [Bulleidia sp.]